MGNDTKTRIQIHKEATKENQAMKHVEYLRNTIEK